MFIEATRIPDTDAERFYRSLNWNVVGRIGYALFPDGRPCDTTYCYKELEIPGPEATNR